MTVKRKADEEEGGVAKTGSFDGIFNGTVPRSAFLNRSAAPNPAGIGKGGGGLELTARRFATQGWLMTSSRRCPPTSRRSRRTT